MDIESSDVEFTGVGKDLDAESTGVAVDTGAYGSESYDAVPHDQGNKIKVYGLGQQVPTQAQEKREYRSTQGDRWRTAERLCNQGRLSSPMVLEEAQMPKYVWSVVKAQE